MSAKPNFFRIGLFMMVGLAILAGGLIAFGSGQIFKKRIYMETYVNSTVQGVDKGTPVKFRGVPIGNVSAITFSFNEYGTTSEVDRYNYIVILMEIDKEMFPGMFDENLTPLIEKNIKQGMRARIEPLGITGMNYIDINYVKDPAEFPPLEVNWTPRNYYIPSAPGQLASILDSVNNMMSDMKKLNLGDVQSGISQLLANLNKAVTDADLNKVSTDLQVLITGFNTAVKEANIGPLSDEARTLMSGLQKSNADLQSVLKNLKPATRFDAGEVRAIVNSLAVATANLESFSSSIKQRPSSLLWGGLPKPIPAPAPIPAPRKR
ncbi:MAG: MlaD family protein [Verrucomicrobiota bacterium]